MPIAHLSQYLCPTDAARCPHVSVSVLYMLSLLPTCPSGDDCCPPVSQVMPIALKSQCLSVSYRACLLPMCCSVCPCVMVSVSHRYHPCVMVSVPQVLRIAHASQCLCLTGAVHCPCVCVPQVLPMCLGVCVPQVLPIAHVSQCLSHRCCPLPIVSASVFHGCCLLSVCLSVCVPQVLPVAHVSQCLLVSHRCCPLPTCLSVCLCPTVAAHSPCVSVSVSHSCCPLPMCLSVCLCPTGAAHCPRVRWCKEQSESGQPQCSQPEGI